MLFVFLIFGIFMLLLGFFIGVCMTYDYMKQERAELDRMRTDIYVEEEIYRHNKARTNQRIVDEAKKRKKQAGYSNLSGRR